MGYVRKRKLYRLVFPAGELSGLEVVAKAASVSTYERIAKLAGREFTFPPSEDDLAAAAHLYQEFANVLVSWNLEEHTDPLDDDSPLAPVPATLEGLKEQDLPFVQAIILAWMEAVEAALLGQSPDLQPDLESSLPMEPLVA